ncbi:MAG: hypothetical protein FWG30_09495 [Eubacteriaceae bacterium]|nr:hypothetical protein [Eubacteriaceae bacterium]
MQFKIYSSVDEFYSDAYSMLAEGGAQNMIMLGNLEIGYKGDDKHGWRDPSNWFMASVSDDGHILLTAMMTPPFNITLCQAPGAESTGAIECLAAGLKANAIALPGVIAEKTLAERFASAYTKEFGAAYSIKFDQRIFELAEVSSETKLTGELRLLNERDLSFLPFWLEAFNSDCFGMPIDISSSHEGYAYEVASEKFYVLCDDDAMPVSMAKVTREVAGIAGVGYVYTPPYLRRKGYATSCVAKLSSLLLESGFSSCALYTDLANPTSNSIYQKIGYKRVCDSLDIAFINI